MSSPGGQPGFASPIRKIILSRLSLASLGILLVLLAGCASSNLTQFTQEVRESFTGDQLQNTEYYVSIDMDFVSLKKGEIIGDDLLFKREIKKTFKISRETPGTLVQAGGDWVVVQWPDSIFLTFSVNPQTKTYQTPGWGTVTIQEERFDINLHVMAGKNVELLVKKWLD